MGMFLFFAGFIGFPVALIALIIALVRKRPKKLWIAIAASCLVLIVIGRLLPKTAPVISSGAAIVWMILGGLLMFAGFLAAVILFIVKRNYVLMALLAIPLGFIIAGGSGILSYDYLNPPVIPVSASSAASASQTDSSSSVPASVSSSVPEPSSSVASLPESSVAESASSKQASSESAVVSSESSLATSLESSSSSRPESSSSSSSQSSSSSSSSASSLSDTQKAKIIETDAAIYDVLLTSEKMTQLIQQEIGKLGSGSGSMLSVYDTAKAAKDAQYELANMLDELRDDASGDYVAACQSYVFNARSVADDLVKYIDKDKISYLSDAKERLENSTALASKAIAERTKYLMAQGLSDDEVLALLAGAS